MKNLLCYALAINLAFSMQQVPTSERTPSKDSSTKDQFKKPTQPYRSKVRRTQSNYYAPSTSQGYGDWASKIITYPSSTKELELPLYPLDFRDPYYVGNIESNPSLNGNVTTHHGDESTNTMKIGRTNSGDDLDKTDSGDDLDENDWVDEAGNTSSNDGFDIHKPYSLPVAPQIEQSLAVSEHVLLGADDEYIPLNESTESSLLKEEQTHSDAQPLKDRKRRLSSQGSQEKATPTKHKKSPKRQRSYKKRSEQTIKPQTIQQEIVKILARLSERNRIEINLGDVTNGDVKSKEYKAYRKPISIIMNSLEQAGISAQVLRNYLGAPYQYNHQALEDEIKKLNLKWAQKGKTELKLKIINILRDEVGGRR